MDFPGGSVVKNLPTVHETQQKCGFNPGLGRSPGEGNGYHSGVLTWRIPWTEEPGGLQSMVLDMAEHPPALP